MSELLALLLSWFMLSAGCSLAAETLEGFQLSKENALWRVPALLGLANLAIGWVTQHMMGVAPFWLVPLVAFALRWPADASLLQLLRYRMPRAIRVRHFGSALLAALIMSAFGTAGEALVSIGFGLLNL